MNRKARRAAQAQSGGPLSLLQNPTAEMAAAEVRRANRYLAESDFELAIDGYVKAIEIQPDLIEAHAGLCRVMLLQGKFDLVIEHIEQILAVSPNYVPGYNVLALARLRAGRPQDALDAVLNGFRRAETAEGKALFVDCLQQLPAFAPSEAVRHLAVRALQEAWSRPSEIGRFCLNAIKTDAATMTALAAAGARSDAAAYGVLAQDALLGSLLENATAADITIERMLTAVRDALLDTVKKQINDSTATAFACTLAQQCFLNEYVYAVTPAEEAALAALRESLVSALRSGGPIAPLSIAVFATYASLGSLDEDDRLLARRWPAAIEALLRQQVREPAEERRLRGTIPRLTPIADEVSISVRAQYEENPYPRWIKVPAVQPSPIDATLRGRFPLADFRPLDRAGPIDILVAGCGTGQQVADVVQQTLDARVLAVDLSLASLAYAKRQTDALGFQNIEYGQADILELGALNRDFDVIECGGVLHHLGDPLAGWRVLLSLLRPEGLMRIALYSERARQEVVAARAFASNYPADRDGIRRFRQDTMALPDSDPVSRLARSRDFFSMSMCRDLAFHVQEHRFMLPQIKTFLAEAGLNFIGFEVEGQTLASYKALFPRDPACTDLDCWDALEKAHPGMFAGMYQFWVQKQA